MTPVFARRPRFCAGLLIAAAVGSSLIGCGNRPEDIPVGAQRGAGSTPSKSSSTNTAQMPATIPRTNIPIPSGPRPPGGW